MQAGALRESIKFQALAATKDNTGHRDEDWQDIANSTRPAAIEPVSGKRYDSEVGVNTSISTKIRVRFDSLTSARTADDRIVDTRTGDVYEITAPIQINKRRREIVFYCQLKTRG